MKFLIKISIALKEGMLDPEAMAIQHALANLGFITEELKTERVIWVRLEAPDRSGAEETARRMCERLLANPVIHRYEIEVLK